MIPGIVASSAGPVSTGADLPGTGGNDLSVPDSAALDIVGDFDVRVDVALDDYTEGAVTNYVFSKRTDAGSQYAWQFVVNGSGQVVLGWAEGAATFKGATFTGTSLSSLVADGARIQVRATLDVDNGAAGWTARYYTRTDGDLASDIGWTLRDTVTDSGVTSIYATTSVVRLGGINGNESAKGIFYRGIIKDGIAGTTVLDINCVGIPVLGTRSPSSFTATTGQTVTVNGSAWDWTTS